MEFDALHDKESDDEDDLAHVVHHYENLSPWCIPCVEVLESHVFLLSSESQEEVQAEKRNLEESITSMSLSEQALLEQRRTERQKNGAAGGIQTVISAKRLVETLQKIVLHAHSDPIVLDKVAKIFVMSISNGESMPFPALVDALLECNEPERGVIILNALEMITLTEEGVKPMLKHCIGDPRLRSFVFKPLLKFLGDMRSKEECEWQMPKEWSILISKGMKDKVNEIAFLMKELR